MMRWRVWGRAALCGLALIAGLASVPAQAGTEDGLAQFGGGRFAEAMQSWRAASAAGDARAALYVGVLYDTGQGVAPDPQQAADWYGRAAEGGNPAAMFNLGVLHGLGYGVPKDEQAALEWYGRAAAQSFPRAEYALGLLHEDGIGTPRDPARAIGYFQAAARHGITAAQAHLASLGGRPAGAPVRRAATDGMREFQDAQTLLLSRGTAEAGRAAVLLRTAAQSGNAMAAYDLGYVYENGIGVPRDAGEALRWYVQAGRTAPDASLRAMAEAGAASVQPRLDPAPVARLADVPARP